MIQKAFQNPFTFIIISLFFISTDAYSANDPVMEVHFVKVGYGDAILLKLPEDKVMLVDAGPEESSVHLLDYLRSNDIQKIDHAVITHPHTNHFFGFTPIIEKMDVGHFWINGDEEADPGYGALVSQILKQSTPVQVLTRGMVVDPGTESVTIQVLHPNEFKSDPNANSLVLWIQYNDVSFLLTGDIGLIEQEELVRMYPFVEQANCVQVPHHGGGVSERFAKAFPQAIFVASTGPNEWGFPHEADLKKFSKTVFQTALHGPIIFKTNGHYMNFSLENYGEANASIHSGQSQE